MQSRHRSLKASVALERPAFLGTQLQDNIRLRGRKPAPAGDRCTSIRRISVDIVGGLKYRPVPVDAKVDVKAADIENEVIESCGD
jgi:hypothetical protein